MWRTAAWHSAVGLEVAVAIVFGYFGGHWLDNRLGTGPWLGYLGLLAGIGAAVKALARVVRSYRKSLQTQESHDQLPGKEGGSAGPR